MREPFSRIRAVDEQDDDKRAYQRLSTATDLETVMLSALYLEHELKQIVAWCVYEPSQLETAELTFVQKSYLAFAVGLNPDVKSAISVVARIRNRFAHDLNAKLGRSETNNLRDALSRDHRSSANLIFERLSANSSLSFGGAKKIASLSDKDRFLLYVIHLRSVLRAGRLQIEQANPQPV